MAIANRCDFSVGDVIDRKYTVTKVLGEGAFGKVFKVTKGTRDVYALKLLKLWEVAPEIRQQLCDRFEMEFQTGQIKSPYLVHSIDRGFVEGNPYILMEFCPKGDLSSCSRSTDWNLVGQQILLGLKALHQCGKVHRDLKPENVLLKADGTAALTDFGISGDRNKRMTERNILGKPQQIFGTYAYMPPEQVMPRAGDATVLPTTDIFSFGVVMYQLLTGVLPFGTLNDQNDLVMYIKNGKEGKWNRSALRMSTYGAMFLPVIEGCLVPDFKQRLQSVDDVLALLPHISHNQKHIEETELAKPQYVRGYRLKVMQGEEYGKVYDLTQFQSKSSVITMGRNDYAVNNTLSICENQSRYISRRHCTLEFDVISNVWFIRDGQWDAQESRAWKKSLNGTYVNAKEVSTNGYFLSVGDIISIGDTKLRMEAY